MLRSPSIAYTYIYTPGYPGRKRARPRAGVTLFSNFPFMGYRLVSICRFVTTPGDLHGQIGLLHAVTFPSLPPSFPSPLASFYITIFRHRKRDLPPDISLRDNLFFLLLFFLSLRVSFSFSFFYPSPFVRRSFLEDNARPRTLHFKCERESRTDRRIDRESRARIYTD